MKMCGVHSFNALQGCCAPQALPLVALTIPNSITGINCWCCRGTTPYREMMFIDQTGADWRPVHLKTARDCSAGGIRES